MKNRVIRFHAFGPRTFPNLLLREQKVPLIFAAVSAGSGLSAIAVSVRIINHYHPNTFSHGVATLFALAGLFFSILVMVERRNVALTGVMESELENRQSVLPALFAIPFIVLIFTPLL